MTREAGFYWLTRHRPDRDPVVAWWDDGWQFVGSLHILTDKEIMEMGLLVGPQVEPMPTQFATPITLRLCPQCGRDGHHAPGCVLGATPVYTGSPCGSL